MLTKEQLSVIARENGVPLFTQERDYFQLLFLSRLYSRKVPLVFKGGTCLKFAYSLPRFSEDLDFNISGEGSNIKFFLNNALDDLKLLNFESELKVEKKLKVGVGYKIQYKGPLYTGKNITLGSILIDVSFRKDMIMEPELLTIPSEYPEISPFLASCMPIEEIFSEKIRSLIKRSKPRDIYDMWYLINKGVKIDMSLINEKIELQKLKFDLNILESEIESKRNDWKNDLSPLINFLPDFDGVKNDLLRKLGELLE